MRGRSYSYSPSPSPPRRYCQRKRSPRPRGRYRGRDTNFPTSLWFGTSTEIADHDYGIFSLLLVYVSLVDLLLALHELIGILHLYSFSRPQDLHSPFGQFGLLKDVYLPRDYYTGYVFFHWLKHDAKYHMDSQILLGRELTIVFAEENRKKLAEMRARERIRSRDRSYDYRRSPRTYSPSANYSPPRQRDRKCRDPSYSRSPYVLWKENNKLHQKCNKQNYNQNRS
ncbi:Serine/arginine-rich SC35-like splicing factor SCL30A [Glycine soja]|uniref:Serine/arginine-rich SC35-like splicing factor SCL30A n=1 Tax=Glycine soja TaxID=3848 RepID=A0A445LQ57_GLYSO|nr:Serine/arginine-rich SC35-like splicing factor SCL30A [Glycine soja]